MAQWFGALMALAEDTGSTPLHPHGGSQPSATVLPSQVRLSGQCMTSHTHNGCSRKIHHKEILCKRAPYCTPLEHRQESLGAHLYQRKAGQLLRTTAMGLNSGSLLAQMPPAQATFPDIPIAQTCMLPGDFLGRK